ncbi:MAG: 4Fe-4S binding protein [Clostridiales bacterium]|nr:4Fe-4S binding protein [Clostridiales bacterium]
MIYRDFGNSGARVSSLGFGCMRFPMIGEGDAARVDDSLVTPMIKRAYELGVNYFDTAWGYCNSDSQRALGVAVKGFRDKIYISTKLPMWSVKKADDFWYFLKESLKRLDMDYIDFYHFHSMNREHWEQVVLPFKLIDLAEQAKAKGMIRHLSFSFHDKRDLMDEMVDTGAFTSLLCQYNLIDRSNEEGMAYASSKGVGITVMGPVGGGNLALGGKDFLAKFDVPAESGAELAIKFVLGNPSVSIALSGMTSLEMVEENVRHSEAARVITREDWEKLTKNTDELKALASNYCSGCNYCDVCPKGIKPSEVFDAYNRYKVWGLNEVAKRRYSRFGTSENHTAHPDLCISCGACARKCPQRLDIPTELKKMTAELKAL